jgi:hypothetical protein
MEQFLNNPDFREEKAVLAWRQAFKFSWRKTAIGTLEVYRKLLGLKN